MTAVARAFSIGPKEAGAVQALQTRVHPWILAKLKKAVEVRGVRNFLTHDNIQRGLFNLGFTSAGNQSEQWQPVLTNGDDNRVVSGFGLAVSIFFTKQCVL